MPFPPLALVLVLAASPLSGVEFFVDPDCAVEEGDGSAGRPWRELDDHPDRPTWRAIQAALANDDVVVYFSARDAAEDRNQVSTAGINLRRTDTSAHRLTIDGMSRFNADDHAPRWSVYAGASRCEIRAAYPIASYVPGLNQDHVTIRGFKAVAGFGGRGGQALNYWGGSDVVIERCEFTHDPGATHGACVQFGYAWEEDGSRGNGGCHDLVIRGNAIHDTLGEGIYIGGSGNTVDPATGVVRPAHTGVVIEDNTIERTGALGGEGDAIDLKDGLSDVVVRGNRCSASRGGNAAGISSLSPIRAEGNVLHHLAGHAISLGTFWGSGIAGAVIRGNLIFANARDGIYLGTDLAARPMTGIVIAGNTVHGNAGSALTVGSSPDPEPAIRDLRVVGNLLVANGAGLAGWGASTWTITGNDVFANAADYRDHFAGDGALIAANRAEDPGFVAPGDPAGRDGVFFTADDGFALQAASPCATAGEGGAALGALPAARGGADEPARPR